MRSFTGKGGFYGGMGKKGGVGGFHGKMGVLMGFWSRNRGK